MSSKSRIAKKILTGAGVSREDSDDELGVDDLSWEWIFSNERGNVRKIVGARFGSFTCMVGDCVLLKAEGYKEAWVAVICEFFEDDSNDAEKSANFMWFSSDKEIRNREKKRTDALKNELYITPAFDVNPLTAINGSAQVVSLSYFRLLHPSGVVGPKSKDYGKIFVCRRGCNVRTASYTDEFCWEETYRGAIDIDSLIAKVITETKRTRRPRHRLACAVDDSGGSYQQDEAIEQETRPETPRKKSRLDATPSKGTPRKLVTPTHRRIAIKRPLDFTPLGSRLLSPANLSSPFQIARMRLHVSSVPPSLPCREEVFSQVYSHLEAAISDGFGTCIYISGTPGTGKTATVREVVSQLHEAVRTDELDDFLFVEINGMKVTDPHQAYSMLWEALEGDRVSPSHALDLLEREFGRPSPRRVPCVVLMDELDQLVTRNQSVMYNFFNWPSLPHSRLIVIAVANTMDLPERTLSNKISSRLGLARITFPGYTHDQLIKIIQSRLEGVPGSLVDPDAIQFASRKVAAVSGDARRALDICRRAVEIAEGQLEDQNGQEPLTPSKKRQTEVEAFSRKPRGKVIITTIKQAINEATSSPLQECLKSQPLTAKVLLVALLTRLRRSGTGESLLADVVEETRKLAEMCEANPIRNALMGGNCESRANSAYNMGKHVSSARLAAFSTAVVELAEAGIVILEARKGEMVGKIRLNVSEDDVQLALKDDLDIRSLGILQL